MPSLGSICQRVLATMNILIIFMTLSAEIFQPVRSTTKDALSPGSSPIHVEHCLRRPAEDYRYEFPLEEYVEAKQSIKSSPCNLENLTNTVDLELDQNQFTGNIVTKQNVSTTRPAEDYRFEFPSEEHVEVKQSIKSSPCNLENLTNTVDLELDQNQLTSNIVTKQNVSTTQDEIALLSNLTSEELTMKVEDSGLLSTFTPYSSKVPWKTGFVSRLFPRYGHYCGPSWSSGRESGSLVWEKAPVDSLDFCCFQHDIGFDSHEQADLHRADLEFLDCLERIPREGRKAGDHPVSELYRNFYIFGLKRVIIPYRKFLLQNVNEFTRKKLTEVEFSVQERSGN